MGYNNEEDGNLKTAGLLDVLIDIRDRGTEWNIFFCECGLPALLKTGKRAEFWCLGCFKVFKPKQPINFTN